MKVLRYGACIWCSRTMYLRELPADVMSASEGKVGMEKRTYLRRLRELYGINQIQMQTRGGAQII